LRVYAEPDDQTIFEINEAAKKFGISKAYLVLKAVDHFLHQYDQIGSGIDQLKSELDQIRSELDQARSERDQSRADADKRWSEMNALKSDANQLNESLRLQDQSMISF
jgi:uncharacterized protein (DUF3084 family)